MSKQFLVWTITIGVCLVLSCGERINKNVSEEITVFPAEAISVPQFKEDSAYHFIRNQLAYGPRVPDSKSHAQCADYLIAKLLQYGANVTLQEFEGETYENKKLPLKNIIASIYPEKKKRILLASHWDTRPFADKDSSNTEQPIAGANDGASGTGVILEALRAITTSHPPKVGIDVIFFDGEDYGAPEGFKVERNIMNAGKIYWCLGSQYWSKNKHQENYVAYFGILLDMVGAPEAKFYREGGSMQFAKKVVKKVWKQAREIGHDDYFINKNSPGIMDDHIFVNRDAKIPMVSIIDHDPDSKTYFAEYHHTHRDNLSLIDKKTLNAVGETILHVIYKE